MELFEYAIEQVKPFLLANGFIEENNRRFNNDKCTVFIDDTEYCIESNQWPDMELGEYGTMYSTNFSIYTLIGILIYNDLIDKNFKK